MPHLGKDEELRAGDEPRHLIGAGHGSELIEGAVDDQSGNGQLRQPGGGVVRERSVDLPLKALHALERLRGGEAERGADRRLVAPVALAEEPRVRLLLPALAQRRRLRRDGVQRTPGFHQRSRAGSLPGEARQQGERADAAGVGQRQLLSGRAAERYRQHAVAMRDQQLIGDHRAHRIADDVRFLNLEVIE